MRKFLVFLFFTAALAARAQFMKPENRGFSSFLRMKKITLPGAMPFRSVPVLVHFQGNNFLSSFSYWQGAAYTSYSENGRISATHLFDMQGLLRESRTSFTLKKSGLLSSWKIQISPQRTRPLFIYTIPR